jgi:uncharacterized BrkB/YihY/UPF0761 family membrane protein
MTSLWAASAYIGFFMAVSDRIYGTGDRDSFWTGMPMRLGLSLLLLGLVTTAGAVLAGAGPAGRRIADHTDVDLEPLGVLVAFLVWAWLMNLTLLIGVEINRALERRRELYLGFTQTAGATPLATDAHR